MSESAEQHTALVEALRIVEALPGIVAVRRVNRQTVLEVVELESRYERGALVPLKNLGVRVAAQRQVALGVLKDSLFREPPQPTVYLVEEAPKGECPAEHRLTVEDVAYRIVGEEQLPSGRPPIERTIALGNSFLIFPERRSSDKTPSFFLVPPLAFPELQEASGRLGIEGVISISPSAQADTRLREACGFPQDPALATLIVAFDILEQPATGSL